MLAYGRVWVHVRMYVRVCVCEHGVCAVSIWPMLDGLLSVVCIFCPATSVQHSVACNIYLYVSVLFCYSIVNGGFHMHHIC